MKKHALMFVFFHLLLFTNVSYCQIVHEEPDIKKIENPVICKTGIYIKTLRINQTDEEFKIQFYWWLRVDSIDVSKDYKFISDIEFVNASAENENIQEVTNNLKRYYYVTGVCNATFPFKSDYHTFPFDIQKLVISIENKSADFSNIIYIPDDNHSNINIIKSHNIEISNGDEYSVTNLASKKTFYTYKTSFGDPEIKKYNKYSRVNFQVDIKRNPIGILLKLSLPLLIVLILSYLVFFIPDYEIGTSAALTVTALLAAIAFQWTINDSLPKVSYYTLVDKIFYLVYAYIFYAMTQTVITFNLSKGDEKAQKLSDKLESFSIWLFPLTFAMFLIYIIIF